MELPHRNLTQQLAHELGQAILQGKFVIGSNLPSEADISKQYTISRTATREAVKMLTAKGLISSRPRQGIRVLDISNWSLFDPDVLNWILTSKPDLSMLKKFQELRIAIEPQAAYLAANKIQTEELITMESALTVICNEDNSTDDILAAKILFYRTILFASKNPFFIQLQSFTDTILKLTARFTNQISLPTTHKNEQALFENIKNNNPQPAKELALKIQLHNLSSISQKINLIG